MWSNLNLDRSISSLLFLPLILFILTVNCSAGAVRNFFCQSSDILVLIIALLYFPLLQMGCPLYVSILSARLAILSATSSLFNPTCAGAQQNSTVIPYKAWITAGKILSIRSSLIDVILCKLNRTAAESLHIAFLFGLTSSTHWGPRIRLLLSS